MEIASTRVPNHVRRLTLWVALGIVLGLLTAVIGAVGPARAAVTSHTVFFGGWEVGGFLSSTGHFVYCVEPGAFEPSSDQQAPVRAESLPGYTSEFSDPTGWNAAVTVGPATGDVLRRINWLLTVHGQTSDSDTAAVVQLAVWLLRDDPGIVAWVDHHIAWVASHGGAVHVAQAYGLAAEARAATEAGVVGPQGPLVIAQGEELGVGSVTYPSGTQALTLDGAQFDGAGQRLQLQGAAGSASWRAPLHADGWQREHRVAVAGDWQQNIVEWPAAVMLHSPSDAMQQELGSMVGPVRGVAQSTLEPAALLLDSQFSPVLTTAAESRFVQRGGAFADSVTLSVSEGSAPWAARQTAGGGTEFAPVVADGVLYGPFTHPQSVAALPPSGAPVAARVRLAADTGPGAYRVGADVSVTESGYYSWVWRIEETSQRPEVRDAELLPAGYRFSDQFGLVEEGQIVPTSLRWSTSLESRELAIDQLTLRDRLQISLHDGAWLRDGEGERLPAVIRLTAYGVETAPLRAPHPSEAARELARSWVTVTEAGDVSAEPIVLPDDTRGWVTVQACLLDDDQTEQSRGHFAEWCDDFGVPEETAQIVPPHVRTEAQPEVAVGSQFHDAAVVSGLVPRGAQLGFTFYLRPEPGSPKYDERWQQVFNDKGAPEIWSDEELATLSGDERCLAQPVAVTDRVNVTATGTYRSPAVMAQSAGTGYWVEVMTMPQPAAGAETGETEIHRGECGLENERTVVSDVEAEPTVVAPQLADTGSNVDARWGMLGVIPALGGLIMLAGLRRQRLRCVRSTTGQ